MTAIVCGMKPEANALQGPGAQVVMSGGSAETLLSRLNALTGVTRVISMGLAGGLFPDLEAGEIVQATHVLDDQYNVYPAYSMKLPFYDLFGPVVGSLVPHYTAESKAKLFKRTSAYAVDMETGVAAQWANSKKIPFSMIRTISDPQDFTLPPLAYTAMNADGSINYWQVAKSLAGDPFQVPSLLELWTYSRRALENLAMVRKALRL